ncbi:hypothetical protein KO02_01960 [Sphingobacterium sp. ML3W]|nr:hypothetical protein KO02_01960 [Sphingobacterium sp. ML3W]
MCAPHHATFLRSKKYFQKTKQKQHINLKIKRINLLKPIKTINKKLHAQIHCAVKMNFVHLNS